jgi:hypothetical protein
MPANWAFGAFTYFRQHIQTVAMKEGVMVIDHRAIAWANGWLKFGPPLMVAFVLVLTLVVITWEAKADIWTGAGQAATAWQTRNWNIPANWTLNVVPPANDQNTFSPLGEGTIELNGLQSAGAMIFNNFTYTTIAPGTLPANLTMVNPLQGGSTISMGEGVRDTYGVDYFTAGPRFTADVILGAPLAINLGVNAANRLNSSMMFSGQISNLQNNSLTFTGAGVGASLWISSNNVFNGSPLNPLTIASGGGGGGNGYTLHLVDSGRLDGTPVNPTPINLTASTCYLGLQDNRNGGPIPVGSNQYLNSVNSYGGNVYADRSYQSNPLDTTVNVEQYIAGGVTVYQGVANFGSTGPFGRTNNGFDLHLVTLNWDTAPNSVTINVNNGNLTEGRGGSRYVSGANRLQEPLNYTYVSNLSENLSKLVPFTKGGTGVLAVYQVNGGGQWWNAPQVNAGVLRLGTPTIPHTIPVGQSIVLQTNSAALGIGWDTNIVLSGAVTPFPITPAGAIIGQSGAVDIDKWNFAPAILDPNVLSSVQTLTYLRIGSSMGDDASFDPWINLQTDAKISGATQIIPYFIAPNNCYIHYFGGGGGSVCVDSHLVNYNGRNTMLEMGTTGNLLPGRVALGPEFTPNNTYTGKTDVCAGTLQLTNQGSVWGTSVVNVWTYDLNITNGLYATPGPYHNAWEGAGNYSWTGPGQLLLDPQTTSSKDWNLYWYTAQQGGSLFNALQLDGGVIGWTGDVNVWGVPGTYGWTVISNLNPLVNQNVNVLGLGGEYSAGTMTTWFQITDNSQTQAPVLLYKAGKNSKLDLTQNTLVGGNTYTGGTIIAGGEIIVNDANQLNAGHLNVNGGPIVILNGGVLHITSGGLDTNFWTPIKINTSGTPDTQKDCGSVIKVDENVTATLKANFDFSWASTRYLEKTGFGTLIYDAPAPAGGAANAWGLKLTEGLVQVNQMPVNSNADTGPVIFNGGNLNVVRVPAGMALDRDAAYGFRNMVSFQYTTSTVQIGDGAMFRVHGIVPSELLGTVFFSANDLDGNPSNNVVHLSRNRSSVGNGSPGYNTRGNGRIGFTGVTVYMSGGGAGNNLNVLPQEEGFVLQLGGGVVFNASQQNTINGTVYFAGNLAKSVKIDGEEASPATPILPAPNYTFNLVPETWTIAGTGLTSWTGTTEKVGPGTVAIKRSLGAPVTVVPADPLTPPPLLQISGGTFEAGGSADPFTDTATNLSLDIVNNSAATGLLISQGVKNVNNISGVGNTTVSGPAGTELIVNSIVQNNLTLGAGCLVTIRPIPGGHSDSYTSITPVPEPATWILLILAGAGLWGRRLLGRHTKE